MTSRGDRRASLLVLVVSLLVAAPLRGQLAPATPPTSPPTTAPVAPAPPEGPAAPEPPGTIGGLEAGEPVAKPIEERLLPKLDIYFPEGDLDLKVNRLVNKTFFEGQVKYNFINGDITAFLRYRYYGERRTT